MIYQFFLIFALFDDIISYNHGNICLLSVIFLLLLFGALYQIMASGKKWPPPVLCKGLKVRSKTENEYTYERHAWTTISFLF